MNETAAPATEPLEPVATASAEVAAEIEGDFATGERTEPKTDESELHEGDFAAGERTVPEVVGGDPEATLHGDFAAGERTDALAVEDETEGSFADTSPTA
jgi:hypothetical protein